MTVGDIYITEKCNENKTHVLKLLVAVTDSVNIDVQIRFNEGEKPQLVIDKSTADEALIIVHSLEKYYKALCQHEKLHAKQTLPGGQTGNQISLLLDTFL